MAKLMLVASLLVGAGACSSPAPTTQRSTTTTGPTTTDSTSTTEAPTTTTEPPTTTSTTAEPVEEAPTTVSTTRARSAPTTVPYVAPTRTTVASGGDGEWVIPTYIVMCESGGNWNAENASGAAGPYQLMPEHFGGESALNQSREAQHAMAAKLWNGGKGKGNWAECL